MGVAAPWQRCGRLASAHGQHMAVAAWVRGRASQRLHPSRSPAIPLHQDSRPPPLVRSHSQQMPGGMQAVGAGAPQLQRRLPDGLHNAARAGRPSTRSNPLQILGCPAPGSCPDASRQPARSATSGGRPSAPLESYADPRPPRTLQLPRRVQAVRPQRRQRVGHRDGRHGRVVQRLERGRRVRALAPHQLGRGVRRHGQRHAPRAHLRRAGRPRLGPGDGETLLGRHSAPSEAVHGQTDPWGEQRHAPHSTVAEERQRLGHKRVSGVVTELQSHGIPCTCWNERQGREGEQVHACERAFFTLMYG